LTCGGGKGEEGKEEGGEEEEEEGEEEGEEEHAIAAIEVDFDVMTVRMKKEGRSKTMEIVDREGGEGRRSRGLGKRT
jgi:hypothetical protein